MRISAPKAPAVDAGRAGANIPALTGVRAVACAWVFGSHIAQGYKPAPHWLGVVMTPGFMGVDLFFILSGFILAVVYSELVLTPKTIGAFFLKRVMRIYPLNVAIMLFMAEEAWRNNWFGTPWYDPHLFLPVLLMAIPFYTNPPFAAWLATNWSLGVELVCYVCFPLVLICLRQRAGFLIVALLALAVGEAATQRAYLGVFYGTGAFLRGLVGFSMGGVAAFLIRRHRRPDERLVGAGEFLSMAGCLVFLLQGRLWPIPLCMCTLIASLSYGSGPLARVLAARWIVWLGDISYSIYLVHGVLLGEWAWPQLANAKAAMPEPLASLVWLSGLLTVVIATSAFTYYAVEVPGRRLGQTLIRRAGAWIKTSGAEPPVHAAPH